MSKKPVKKNSKIVSRILATFFILLFISYLIDEINNLGYTAIILILLFATIVILCIYLAKKKAKQKLEDDAAELLSNAKTCISLASKSECVSNFIEYYDEALDSISQLIDFEGKVNFSNDPPSYEYHRLENERQWHTRDAIERAFNRAAENIRGIYKNSKEHKLNEFDFFRSDIEECRSQFDEETSEFADVMIRKLANIVGVSASYGSVEHCENNVSIQDIDSMEGHEFEYWCANLLRNNGFKNVEVTPGSGDQGVDILAEKDDVRYAIQCKCYSSNLGNTPVQEVHAGKSLYNCDVAAVMTNRYFTSGAQELAAKTNVRLWDRDKIAAMIEQAKSIK